MVRRTRSALHHGRHVPHNQKIWAAYAAVFVVIALAVALFVTHASSPTPASGNGLASTQSSRHFWCGLQGEPACPTADPHWVAVPSGLPGDVAAVIAHHPMFAAIEKQYGSLSLDLPALVHPFGVHAGEGSDYYLDDHWVVSARNDAGQECGIFDFVYDSAHGQIRFSSFAVLHPQDPRYGRAFPYVSLSTAQDAIRREHNVGVSTSVQPVLIFFPLAPGWMGPGAQHHWSAGGTSPMDPMWLLEGVDGHYYLVGSDSHAHTAEELPIAQ